MDLPKLNQKDYFLLQKGLQATGYMSPSVSVSGNPGPKTQAAYDDYCRDAIQMKSHFIIAQSEIGTKEYSGSADNPDVVKYLKSVDTLPRSLQAQDETAWCAAFVNWCLEKAGKQGTEKANARSYLNYGSRVNASQVKQGDIVVFWRGDPKGWQGHVGFVDRVTDNYVYCLGGNQSDAVNVTRYPKSRVLGYRRP